VSNYIQEMDGADNCSSGYFLGQSVYSNICNAFYFFVVRHYLLLIREVVSLQSGSYRIKTDSLGVITLQQHQVKSISHGAVSTQPSASLNSMKQASQSAVQSLQSSITSDPGMMASILALQNDPDMQAVLSDPELMRAIQSFDLEALQNNPKIQQLMNNSTVRKIHRNVD
jgi:hypothetical protein